MKAGGANCAIFCALFLCSGAAAVSEPYSLAAPGSQFKPRMAQPTLKSRPVINRSLGRVQRPAVSTLPYTAITKRRARRQGTISAGGVRWNCTGNRCTTNAVWARPTVKTCKVLARSVGTIQSYGRRGAGLNTVDIHSCNTGIMVAKSNRKPRTILNHGLAVRTPVLAPRLPVRGGFAPRTTTGRLAPGTSPPERGIVLRTGPLKLTGRGIEGEAEVAAATAAFTSIQVRTGVLKLTGRGIEGEAEVAAATAAFIAVRKQTGLLKLTGLTPQATGRLAPKMSTLAPRLSARGGLIPRTTTGRLAPGTSPPERGIVLRTGPLKLTGRGIEGEAEVAAATAAFTSIQVRTGVLKLTGRGIEGEAEVAAATAAFIAVRKQTGLLKLTGLFSE